MRLLLAALIYLVAAPPGTDPSSPESQWYQSLRVPDTGGSCCGVADCRHFPVQIVDGHYQALYDGQWLDVPKSAIIEGEDNPTGDYVTCVHDYVTNNMDGTTTHKPTVLCFKRTPQA